MLKLKQPAGFSLKRFIIIFLSIGIAAGGTMGLKSWAVQNRPMEKILVASHDIAPYRVLDSQDLGYISMPLGSKQPNSLQDPKSIIGKVAMTEIFKGEQILPQKLGDSPLIIGPDERQVSIPIDAVKAVGMTVNAGDKVDVYWVPKANNNAPNNAAQDIIPGKPIALDATVIDIRNKNSQSILGQIRSDLNNPGSSKSSDDQLPAIAVLKVKNSEVPGITGATADGMIILAKKGDKSQ